MRLRRELRRALFRAAHVAHLPRLLDSIGGKRVRGLVYHGVTASEEVDPVVNRHGFSVTRRELEQHLEYVGRNCHPVSLDDVLQDRGLSATRINVLVTFDDAYENNYTNALPSLERYGVPAVFSLVTSFVERREPLWNDVIEYAVARSPRSEARLPWEGGERTFPLVTARDRAALLDALLHRCVSVEQTQRDGLVAAWAEALEAPDLPEGLFAEDDYRPMTRAQITEMAASGLVEFASHTESHYLLAKVDPEVADRELDRSRRLIGEWTGTPCKTLSLPGGSYDSGVLERSFAAGYDCLLTSDGGFAAPGERTLGRVCVLRGTRVPEFADLVHGPIGRALARLRGRRVL